jgi:hypothetical protein
MAKHEILHNLAQEQLTKKPPALAVPTTSHIVSHRSECFVTILSHAIREFLIVVGLIFSVLSFLKIPSPGRYPKMMSLYGGSARP